MAIITANTPSLFELATRQRLRFDSPRGKLSVEDLWDLPLTGPVSLDAVAKQANREVKASEEESFVTDTSSVNDVATQKLNVVKHIIAVRKNDLALRQAAAEKAERKRKLLDLLAQKDDEKDASLSREDILKELESL